MNFYSDGTTIGVSITIWGLLFLAYLSFEIYSLYKTRMLFIHKLLLYFRVKRDLKRILPPWWCIKRIRLFSMYKKSKYLVSPPEGIKVHVDFKIKEGNPSWWVDEEITVNIFGKRKTSLDNLDLADITISDDIKKKYKRNSILEELGI